MFGRFVRGQSTHIYKAILANDFIFMNIHLAWIFVGLVAELTVTVLAFYFQLKTSNRLFKII